MYNAAIIGAGQLGSRHLQGLKTSVLPFNIWVMDNSEEALEIARQRYEQVESLSEKNLQLVKAVDELPESLDFVVVATGSLPRAAIVKALLSHSKVRYLILEKFLFPKISDYSEVGALLKETGTICLVNCARRLFGFYHQVQQSLNGTPITMEYEDVDWGLCCNSIHFIDIFMFLTGEKEYSIETDGLTPVVENSKRKGYIEFYGKITILTKRGDRLILKCHKEGQVKPIIKIINTQQTILINEAEGSLEIDGNKTEFRLPYQSETTGLYADMLIKIGYCSLTPFSQSAAYHICFLKGMLDFYNKINNSNEVLLPIT